MSVLYTTGDIARILGRTLHEVTHIVGDKKHNIPVLKQRRGNNRLLGPAGLSAIRDVFESRKKADADKADTRIAHAVNCYTEPFMKEIKRLASEVACVKHRLSLLEEKLK